MFCDGVWGPNQQNGEKASIEFSLEPIAKSGKISFTIFNFDDLDHLVWCREEHVASGLCNSTELGMIHVNYTGLREAVFHETISWGTLDTTNSTTKYVYPINNTGLYCTEVDAIDIKEGQDFKTIRTVRNPYGLLDGYLYPALPFYRALSIVYSVIGVGWMTVSFLYWKELLPIQHYVSLVIAFLVTEMASNYGYFEHYNQTGTSCTKF